MITLFLLSLIATALMLLSVPVVLFALMVETCADRGAAAGSRDDEPHAASGTASGSLAFEH